MSLTPADLAQIRSTSAALIAMTGETVIRRRADHRVAPRGLDTDLGESTSHQPPATSDLSFPAKLFWNPSERQLMTSCGAVMSADVLAHIPWATDVQPADTIIIRNIEYRILTTKEPPLKGFLAIALERKQDQPGV